MGLLGKDGYFYWNIPNQIVPEMGYYCVWVQSYTSIIYLYRRVRLTVSQWGYPENRFKTFTEIGGGGEAQTI